MATAQVSSRTLAPKVRSARPARGALQVAAVQKSPYERKYASELVETTTKITTPGRGLMACDESNPTAGLRLASIGVENSEENRMAYRELLLGASGIGEYISGAILFEETLYQGTSTDKSDKGMVNLCNKQGIVPGIKVDTGLRPLAGTTEKWCQGLDGLAERTAKYYEQGARFAKWRTVVDIQEGPSEMAIEDAAYGLARYASICQDSGLVPIVEPEILLDGEHDIDTTMAVAQRVWAATFKRLMDNGVLLEGILLKPSMITAGAEYKGPKPSPEVVADYTLRMLRSRVPPAVPGIMFLSGGQSEVEATLNLNAMNKGGPNPWHVAFSYARALQNSCLKTWVGKPENVEAAQAVLLKRAKANSDAQKGVYSPEGEDAEALKGMFEKGYVY